MDWKKVLIGIILVIGLIETFSEKATIDTFVAEIGDDPLGSGLLFTERLIIWEILTPVIPLPILTPSGNMVAIPMFSFFDIIPIVIVCSIAIMIGRALNVWSKTRFGWFVILFIGVITWLVWKAWLLQLWFINNKQLFGFSEQESIDILMATSGFGSGLIGILIMITSVFGLSLLFGWLMKVSG